MATKTKKKKQPKASIQSTDTSYQPYKVKATGVQFYPNATDDPIRFADPIYVDGWYRYEEAEDDAQLYLKYHFFDQSNKKIEGQFSRDELMNPGELFKQLFKRGYGSVPLSKVNCDHLAAYFLQSVPTKVTILTPRICWRGKKFGWPGKTRGHKGQFYRYKKAGKAHPIDLSKAGTLDEWVKKVFALVLFSDILIFVVGLAFAALVRRKFTDEPGGGYHIVGPSSNGKSLGLMAAISVHGKPVRASIPSWKTTEAALEETIIQHADILLCLDDTGHLKSMKPTEAAALVHDAAFGTGREAKRRSGRAPNSPVQSKNPVQANALLLSTGETSTQEIMQAGKLSALPGAEVRLVNIRIPTSERGWGIFNRVKKKLLKLDISDEAMSRKMAERLEEACTTYHGTAGRHLTSYVTKHFDKAETSFNRYLDDFQKTESPHQSAMALRIKKRIGMSYAGNMLAVDAGILPKKPEKFMNVTKWIFANSMENVVVADPSISVIDLLKQLKGHAKKIAEATDLTAAEKAEKFGGFTDDGDRYAGKLLLKHEALLELTGNSKNVTRLISELTRRGCLPQPKANEKRTIVFERSSVPGRPRVYAIDMTPLKDI